MALPVPPRWLAALEGSIKRNRSERSASWAQLATVRPDGRPAVRTVVHRGVLTDLGPAPVLSFVTDARSDKVAQVAAQPAVELAWYFPVTREQWRVGGVMAVVTAGGVVGAPEPSWGADALEGARRAAWERMSDAGRAQFAWPTPGAAREGGDDAFIPSLPLDPAAGGEGAGGEGGGGDAPPAPALPPDAVARAYAHFSLCLLRPDAVEWLCLKYAPTQRRARHVLLPATGEWETEEVNP